jgi:hypothetical protein
LNTIGGKLVRQAAMVEPGRCCGERLLEDVVALCIGAAFDVAGGVWAKHTPLHPNIATARLNRFIAVRNSLTSTIAFESRCQSRRSAGVSPASDIPKIFSGDYFGATAFRDLCLILKK